MYNYKGERIKKFQDGRKKLVGSKNPSWKGGYKKKGIARYDYYASLLKGIEEIRRWKKDKNVLEVRCTYCNKWFIPNYESVSARHRFINKNNISGEHRFYCSDKCKQACPIFGQILYPKGFKRSTSREIQSELRKMRFEIDNYTCQKCSKHQDELDVPLHCHHLEGIKWEVIESADLDRVITLCKNCHKEVHQLPDCGYNDLKCAA